MAFNTNVVFKEDVEYSEVDFANAHEPLNGLASDFTFSASFAGSVIDFDLSGGNIWANGYSYNVVGSENFNITETSYLYALIDIDAQSITFEVSQQEQVDTSNLLYIKLYYFDFVNFVSGQPNIINLFDYRNKISNGELYTKSEVDNLLLTQKNELLNGSEIVIEKFSIDWPAGTQSRKVFNLPYPADKGEYKIKMYGENTVTATLNSLLYFECYNGESIIDEDDVTFGWGLTRRLGEDDEKVKSFDSNYVGQVYAFSSTFELNFKGGIFAGAEGMAVHCYTNGISGNYTTWPNYNGIISTEVRSTRVRPEGGNINFNKVSLATKSSLDYPIIMSGVLTFTPYEDVL